MFKEFKEMALRGGIIAPIDKERLETELDTQGIIDVKNLPKSTIIRTDKINF